MAQPAPQAKPRTIAYAIERRRDNTFSATTLVIEGDRIVKRSETDADTLDAALGRLFQMVTRSHTA